LGGFPQLVVGFNPNFCQGRAIVVPAQPVVQVEILAFLQATALCQGLDQKTIQRLAADFHLRKFSRGETIFHEGDESRQMFIITIGKVRIFTVTPSGDETTINIFRKGDLVGEFAAVDEGPRSASAKAIFETQMLAISGEWFVQHMRENSQLAINLARLLAAKARWTTEYAHTIARYDAAGRLLHILLLYYNQQKERVGENSNQLDFTLSQSDLASMVGASREWVNHLLSDWKKRGLLEHKGGRIILLDLAEIEAERNRCTEKNTPTVR
jgi:CRP/FNR family transcriptional regulator, cyclic AMP receptor protein